MILNPNSAHSLSQRSKTFLKESKHKVHSVECGPKLATYQIKGNQNQVWRIRPSVQHPIILDLKTDLNVKRLIPILFVGVILAGWSLPQRQADWNEVDAIFQAKCVSCHAGEEAARGLRLDSWENLVMGSDFGEAIIAYDADNSLVIELATKYEAGSHPGELGEAALTEEEIAVLRDWIDSGAPSSDGEIPFSNPDDPRLYVANQGAGMVAVIDMNTNQVARMVNLMDLGFSEFSMPHHIAVEEDGSFWYVSLIMDNKILKFTRDNELVGQVDAVRPGLLALDPVGPWLYGGRSMMSVSPPESVVQIDRETMESEEIGLLMPRPHALLTNHDGSEVYISSLAQNRVATYHDETGDLVFDDVEGDRPHVFIHFTISPDGKTMVGTSEVTSNAFVFDLESSEGVALVDTIGVLRAPWHPIYTADGKWVVFGNNWTNTITILDMEKRAIAKVIEGVEGLAQPHGSAASPDGRYVYISQRNLAMPDGHSKEDHVYHARYDFGDNAHIGTVVVLDMESMEIVKVIETEEYASGMGAAVIRNR